MRTIFTTGEAARILNVAPRTVAKWFDSGRLRGYRIPGSQDRRIPRNHLIRFIIEHNLPLGELASKVLFVNLLEVQSESLQRQWLSEEGYVFKVARNGQEALNVASSFNPDCVVIDFGMVPDESVKLAEELLRMDGYANVVMIALVSDEDIAADFDRSYFNQIFLKPCDDSSLAGRIRELVLIRKSSQ